MMQDILPSDLPGSGEDSDRGLDNPDTSRWLLADVIADGRSDLLYVDYTEQLKCSEQSHSFWPKPKPTDLQKPEQVSTKIDLCEKDTDTSGLRVYTLLSDGSVSDGDGIWEPKKPYFWQEFDAEDIRQWRPMDVDGDGRVDLVHIQHAPEDNPGLHVTTLFSRGDGEWAPESSDPSPDFAPRDTASWRPMDVNGDGKMDLVRVYNLPSDNSSSSSTCVNTLMSGFAYDKENDVFNGEWIRRPNPQNSGEVCLNLGIPDTLNWKPADVNGDGKVDLVHVGKGSDAYVIDALLSTGSANHWQTVRNTAGSGRLPDIPNWRPADVNGDGRTDIVHVRDIHIDVHDPPVPQPYDLRETETLLSTGVGEWKALTHSGETSVQPHSTFHSSWARGR